MASKLSSFCKLCLCSSLSKSHCRSVQANLSSLSSVPSSSRWRKAPLTPSREKHATRSVRTSSSDNRLTTRRWYGVHLPKGPWDKRGHLICFKGQEQRKGVVMGCRSWDEQRDIKLSLSRSTCRGHRSGDLTFCWDSSCQGKQQSFGMRRKERDYACVCVFTCRETLKLSPSGTSRLFPKSVFCCPFPPVLVSAGETQTLFCPSVFLFYCHICLFSNDRFPTLTVSMVLEDWPFTTESPILCSSPHYLYRI